MVLVNIANIGECSLVEINAKFNEDFKRLKIENLLKDGAQGLVVDKDEYSRAVEGCSPDDERRINEILNAMAVAS